MPEILEAEELDALLESPPIERRSASLADIEVNADSGRIRFRGMAATFDTVSHDFGGVREVVRRGAYKEALRADTGNIFFLGLEHNDKQPLARTGKRSGPGSLVLAETPKGLSVDAELVNTSIARDLAAQVDAGVVTEMSYGFRMREPNDREIRGRQTVTREDGYILRSIEQFYRLLDVTPAIDPCYPGTSASMRSMACGALIIDDLGEVQEDVLREIAWKIHLGQNDATDEERAAVDAAFARIETVSPWIAERALRAASLEPELRASIPGKTATVTLEDAESGSQDAVFAFRLAARKRRLRALGIRA